MVIVPVSVVKSHIFNQQEYEKVDNHLQFDRTQM